MIHLSGLLIFDSVGIVEISGSFHFQKPRPSIRQRRSNLIQSPALRETLIAFQNYPFDPSTTASHIRDRRHFSITFWLLTCISPASFAVLGDFRDPDIAKRYGVPVYSVRLPSLSHALAHSFDKGLWRFYEMLKLPWWSEARFDCFKKIDISLQEKFNVIFRNWWKDFRLRAPRGSSCFPVPSSYLGIVWGSWSWSSPSESIKSPGSFRQTPDHKWCPDCLSGMGREKVLS
jgi:hypothetical protein